MPGGDLKSPSLSLCLPIGMKAYLLEHEQERGRRTLMNLTTFFPVS
jgi:hypothetical protein